VQVRACLPPKGWTIPPEEIAKRLDLRESAIVCSVDPPGCVDIDDALHVRALPSGTFEVGIHIADVGHFIKAGTPIDEEAALRATTVYLVQRRVNMVPERLGEDLCSLFSGVDRLAFSALVELSADGEVLGARFVKTVIRSKAALSYAQAQARIDDKADASELTLGLRTLNTLAKALNARRRARGSLVLASPEVRFQLDDASAEPKDMGVYELKETNAMVEEFMLLANTAVAREIHRHFPQFAILRRHPPPRAGAFDTLQRALAQLSPAVGLNVGSSRELADSLDAAVGFRLPGGAGGASGEPFDPYLNKLVRIMATRSMQQAEYFRAGAHAQDAFWHYGLAAEIYTHFTSPIRRYADQLVHRMLAAVIGVEPLATEMLRAERLEALVDNMNRRHVAAQHAGRASVNVFTLFFFRDRTTPAVEDGYVIGLREKGVVVLVPRYGIEVRRMRARARARLQRGARDAFRRSRAARSRARARSCVALFPSPPLNHASRASVGPHPRRRRRARRRVLVRRGDVLAAHALRHVARLPEGSRRHLGGRVQAAPAAAGGGHHRAAGAPRPRRGPSQAERRQAARSRPRQVTAVAVTRSYTPLFNSWRILEHALCGILACTMLVPCVLTLSALGFASPVGRATAARPRASVAMRDFPKPNIENTDNYRTSTALTDKLKSLKGKGGSKKVAIIGGGLSGLAAAKYLVDAGHQPTVYEARDVLGGKVSAWQDADGDWIETGLHIFFGAYPNMMNLLSELDLHDRLQWKMHKMIFAMQQLPGEFTSFDFIPGIPAPFNFGLAILSNQKMLTLWEKLQTAPPLLPMLIEGQDFIDAQDELSVTDFMRKYGMPERINEEVFIAMAKALDFIDPDKLSMTVVLTAMNRFLNEDNGLQMAFLDGNQPDRVCAPMKAYIEARGGKVHTGTPLKAIEVDEVTGEIIAMQMRNGDRVVADEYISAMPVDVLKRMVPTKWSTMPYFKQLDELEGIPVINLHMWFNKKLKNVDHLCFSRSPLLSVYADMSTTCKEYHDEERSMLELVFAPCSPIAGGNVNWIAKSDDVRARVRSVRSERASERTSERASERLAAPRPCAAARRRCPTRAAQHVARALTRLCARALVVQEIIDATMGELARLFPTEIAADPKWPTTLTQGPDGTAKLRKYAVVKTPRSVYAAVPGRNKYRPSQESPIPKLTLCGCFTSQKVRRTHSAAHTLLRDRLRTPRDVPSRAARALTGHSLGTPTAHSTHAAVRAPTCPPAAPPQFLGSMEGAVLAGKLAAEVVASRAAGLPTQGVKAVQADVVSAAAKMEPRKPRGVIGNDAVAFGGGSSFSKTVEAELTVFDPAQLVPLG
jgi:15-cis-phytoene desaturase